MTKFTEGNQVVLSEQGREELPALVNAVGVVIPWDRRYWSPLPTQIFVQWPDGKMVNHVSNLELVPPQSASKSGGSPA